MADRSLVFTWGQVVRGREERALENFQAVTTYYGGRKRLGEIEQFDVVLLEPNAAMGGMMILQGSEDQLRALRHQEQFLQLMAESSLIVDDLTLFDGFVGQGVADRMALFAEAIHKVPQMA
jgi:hypothetical protein